MRAASLLVDERNVRGGAWRLDGTLSERSDDPSERWGVSLSHGTMNDEDWAAQAASEDRQPVVSRLAWSEDDTLSPFSDEEANPDVPRTVSPGIRIAIR